MNFRLLFTPFTDSFQSVTPIYNYLFCFDVTLYRLIAIHYEWEVDLYNDFIYTQSLTHELSLSFLIVV